ncbi:MAG: aminotransferase class I/II-fold pyridoxal phosphate-dependent enzyme [Deinococcota bacterium]
MTQKKRGTEILYGLIKEARGYDDAIILGRGDPDFDTPAHIIAAAQEAMKQKAHEASPPEGSLALRQAIAERVKAINGFEVDPASEVVVTNGGQEALFLMVLAAIGEGEALLVPEPNYNTYKDSVTFAKGHVVGMPTYPNEAFRVDPERVLQTLTPEIKALLLVSPNNPAASVISKEDQLALLDIAKEHDLIIIADDIYDLIIYDDFVHTSPASLPDGLERTLTLNALSKTYAMTGWRMGWVTGPADLMARVKDLKTAVSGPASTIAQYAALAALTGPQAEMHTMIDTYKKRRHIVLDYLDQMGFSYGTPQGGQFVFVDIQHTGMSSLDLAQKVLTNAHVLAYPGGAFSEDMDHFLRITFLQPEDKLGDGLSRMKDAMDIIAAEA